MVSDEHEYFDRLFSLDEVRRGAIVAEIKTLHIHGWRIEYHEFHAVADGIYFIALASRTPLRAS